jgi:peroxiredoxin
VDDEPIILGDWQRAVARDHAMSALVGQTAPSPEETLTQLINERLVLRAANVAGIPNSDQAQAEEWLRSFLAHWELEDSALEEALGGVGLTRADLVTEILPQLLQVQRALEELSPTDNTEAWLADLRRQAKIEILVNLSAYAAPNLPLSATSLTSTTPEPPLRPTPTAVLTFKGPQVGEAAPDFSLKRINKTDATDVSIVRLSDLRGQAVILNFWASWCTPCRQELSLLQNLQNDDLTVLAIAVRESPEKVITFATDLSLELPLLLDPNGLTSDAYKVRGLPTSLFVDHTGIIVARHVGPLDQETLENHLALLAGP